MIDTAATRGVAQAWSLSKPQATGTRGIVAAQHREAAETGARILSQGGNAMDAAVAAALVLSVVEPWLSGIGGGGFLLHGAADGTVDALDFNLRSPLATDPADYPLAGGSDGDWFDWPAVRDNRNISGGTSICTPGAVAGLAAGLERFGTMSWADVVAPAVQIAERGMVVDWFADLAFAIDRPNLLGNSAATMLFLNPEIRQPHPDTASAKLLPMPNKAAVLRRLAERGPRDFYEGETAALILEDLSQIGSVLTASDLRDYRVEWKKPQVQTYRDRQVCVIPGLSGGPSLLHALAELQDRDMAAMSDARQSAAHAVACRRAYEHRLTTMGHAAATEDCTSHLSVVDAAGNMVSLTNTLLSRFGSKVVLPQTDIVMNNGMMWFDPRPGQPNSIAPGVKPLANMSPVIALRDGRPEIALGAAGGRQIFPAVLQILSHLIDRGDSPEMAVARPRMDASTATILVDRRAAADVATAISEHHPVQLTDDTVYPVQFAIPSLVQAGRADGTAAGAAHPVSPWAAAVAAT
ncbi:gamma-glutamyltransferase [Paracoccus sp. 1_MG-2023]|uniref:gamma-glutamyltransferase n=1 Tax=unclassified Paracoccus (in: a-proteobacteria) TaxID=2688777 RepID=UPI001C083506|nr:MULTISPECIES: gamma-glutamyltransferase [unclassified Paracoccus (in: a-proteobacteria)]MBU2957940.1 gamma-glutamyltransferase [Paracoccus sp. C2R09]MDO6668866.1 gamma-glutamyltransferase [Paracoccus sp. 1_MG-2023]